MSGGPKRKAPPGCYWRGDVLWGRITYRNREFRRSLETDHAGTARSRRAALKASIVATAYGDARLTFEQVLGGWGDWIPRQVGPGTVKAYANALEQIAPHVAGKYLDEVDGKLVAAIIRARRKKGITDATIKRGLVALSSVINFAIDEGYCESNAVLPRLKRIKERRDPIVLPRPEDVEKVISRAPGMFATMIAAARATGARQEELASARHSHLDRKGKRLTVIGKGNKLRVIDLGPLGAAAIFDSLPEGIAKAPLFWHGKVQRYRNVSSRFALFVRQIAGKDPDFVPFRFHDLRHLHAVEWLRSGRSIYDLQQRLGHTSIKTTEVYLKYLTAAEVLVAKGMAPAPGTIAVNSDQKSEASD